MPENDSAKSTTRPAGSLPATTAAYSSSGTAPLGYSMMHVRILGGSADTKRSKSSPVPPKARHQNEGGHLIFHSFPLLLTEASLPQFTPLDCARVPPPLPRCPQRVHLTVASSSVLAFTSKLRVRRSHWSFRGCRVHSELMRYRAHVTARELASPPFEDVYIRAFANRVTPNQRRI